MLSLPPIISEPSSRATTPDDVRVEALHGDAAEDNDEDELVTRGRGSGYDDGNNRPVPKPKPKRGRR